MGYLFDQFEPDSGSATLNGGKPTEAAMGWLVGYQMGRWGFNTYVTQDIYARNIGHQTKLWVSITCKL